MSELLQKLRHVDLSDYTSLPFWSWNNDLDPEELVRQIRAMYENGIHGFIMHARTGLKVEYLSERWFQCIEACLDEAKRLMHENRLERVLVVDGNFNLKGLITVKDIVKATEHPNAAKDKDGKLLVGASIGVGAGTEDRL